MIKGGTFASAKEEAKRLVREKKGIIRMAEAIQAGIHPRTLYELRDVGELLKYARICRVEAVMKPYIEAML